MKKVLFLANHFITLYNFRRELIEQLLKEGSEVVLSLPASKENEYFTKLGCRIVEADIERRSMNPARELTLLAEYIRLMLDEKPDIVFSYTIKCNIYGSIAARITGSRLICNITGRGEMLNDGRIRMALAHMLYRISVRHSYKVFFQNTSDMEYFRENRLIREGHYELIPGSGVNLDVFIPAEMRFDGETRFIFVGRILKLKGIDEYLKAAEMIRAERDDVRFFVAGFPETKEYEDILEKYSAAGSIDYIGFVKNIREWISLCHCTILPSLGGEGVPNALLESASCSRALIASRIPGCTDVVDDGINGLLFEPGNAQDLARAIRQFLSLTDAEKAAMGKKGRQKVENCFDRRIVIRKYLSEFQAACKK